MIARASLAHAYRVPVYATRSIRCASSSHHKYAEKLEQKAQDSGLDLEELKSKAREEACRQQKMEAASLFASLKKAGSGIPSPQHVKTSNARRDSSPVKPLSSILNISKLMASPHTPSQISALWTAYHASRNQGTGRGYICASLPLELYNTMVRVAKKYPVFVAPVPRESPPDLSAGENAQTAHEFFFLQWNFHPAPPPPSAVEPDPFEPVTSTSSNIPESATVLFTPLQEYKHRTSFATPYMVLTFYTDLSRSHGIVLLRGEITPSTTSAATQPGQELASRFLLSQVDAQLLAMALQRFYLWEEGKKDDDDALTAEGLLKRFHEEPEKFNWRDVLKHSSTLT